MMSKNNEYIPPIMFHPGEMLAEKLEELNMPIKEFALRCQKPEKTIHSVLNGGSSITSDMAVRFENVLRIPAHFWMKMQCDYDEFLARQRQQEMIMQAVDWMRNFPVADMQKKGFLSNARTTQEKARSLLEYFGIAKYEAWEDYYQNQTLATAFRLSLSGMENKYSLSAWLRHGELKVFDRRTDKKFSHEALSKQVPLMLRLANSHPEDFLNELIRLCSDVGIVLVYTPHIRNSKARGAVRWINGNPLVQISDCRKLYDIFWFSFFHEIGHIVLHNKKDIFLEGISEYIGRDETKEEEADCYASNLLVPDSVVSRLHLPYSNKMVEALSRKTGIHQAFLVGRMHHLGIIDHCIGKNHIPEVSFS